MRQQRTVVLALIACIIGIAAAADAHALVQKFSGTLDSGSLLPLTEKTMTLFIEAHGDRVIVRNESEYISVSNNSCGTLDHVQVCVGRIYESEVRDAYEAEIVISYDPVQVRLSRSISKLVLGQAAQINATFTAGSAAAKGILFEDIMPDGITVLSANCPYDTRSVTFNGDLEKNKNKTCSYTVRADKPITLTQTATVTYHDGISPAKARDERKLDVESHIRATLQQPALSLGQTGYMNVTLSNRAKGDLDIPLLEFRFPAGLVVQSVGSYANRTQKLYGANRTIIGRINASTFIEDPSARITEDQAYLYTGMLEEGENVTLFFKVQATKVGVSNILINGTYKSLEASYDYASELGTLVAKQDKWVQFEISAGPFESYEQARILVYANSTLPFNFTNFRTTIRNTNIYIPPAETELLQTNGRRKLLDYGFIAPAVKSAKTYDLNITIEYLDQFGNAYQYVTKKTMRVNEGTPVEIKHQLSKQNNSVALVNVTVRNNNALKLEDVLVEDTSENLSAEGKQSIMLNLPSKLTVQPYSYRITLPESAQKRFSITTSVNYQRGDKGFLIKKTTVFDRSLQQDATIDVDGSLAMARKATVGQLIPIDITLENSGGLDAEVTLSLSPSPDYFIDAEKRILDLAGGVSQQLTVERAIIPLKEGRITVLGPVMKYLNGTAIETKTMAAQTLDVSAGYLDMPVVRASVELPATAEANATVQANITLTNTGTKETVVEIAGKSISLLPNEKTQTAMQVQVGAKTGKSSINVTGTFLAGDMRYLFKSQPGNITVRPMGTPAPATSLNDTNLTLPIAPGAKRNPLVVVLLVAIAVLLITLLLIARKKQTEHRFAFKEPGEK